jgi:hypothetical protein
MHDKANIEGRQTLLRHRARYIADYEALHQIHFWQPESEPKYIHYFGHLKDIEDWFKKIKDDQGAIYESFEEKSTSIRYTFKDYDKSSILSYDHSSIVIEDEIEKIKNLKNDVSDINFDHLIEKFKDQKNEIECIKDKIHTNINRLIGKTGGS